MASAKVETKDVKAEQLPILEGLEEDDEFEVSSVHVLDPHAACILSDVGRAGTRLPIFSRERDESSNNPIKTK